MVNSDQRQNADNKLYLINMNANGPDGEGQRVRRKELLAKLLRDEKPLLVFMQEFVWADIDASWGNDVKSRYQYSGFVEKRVRKGVGFVFNKEMVKLVPPDEQILTECKIPKTHRARMCVCIMKITSKPNFKRLCISWHGRHNGLDNKQKVTRARRFLSVVNRMKINFDCPVIVGGDFNLKAEIVQTCIPKVRVRERLINTLKVYSAKQTSVDMFLVDKDLVLNPGPRSIGWFNRESHIFFDHDALPLLLQIRKKRG